MSPEALHAYLTLCQFSEDVVQGVIVDYLKKQATVRFPKTWGYMAAKRDQMAFDRARRQLSRVGGVYRQDSEQRLLLLSYSLTPERTAIARQELERIMEKLPARRRGRPRKDAGSQPEAWREDYLALQEEP